MREWNTAYSIDEHITFRAKHFHLYYDQGRGSNICSFDGEFLRDGESFDPKMMYGMADTPVPLPYPVDILRDKYLFLLERDHPDLFKELLQEE